MGELPPIFFFLIIVYFVQKSTHSDRCNGSDNLQESEIIDLSKVCFPSVARPSSFRDVGLETLNHNSVFEEVLSLRWELMNIVASYPHNSLKFAFLAASNVSYQRESNSYIMAPGVDLRKAEAMKDLGSGGMCYDLAQLLSQFLKDKGIFSYLVLMETKKSNTDYFVLGKHTATIVPFSSKHDGISFVLIDNQILPLIPIFPLIGQSELLQSNRSTVTVRGGIARYERGGYPKATHALMCVDRDKAAEKTKYFNPMLEHLHPWQIMDHFLKRVDLYVFRSRDINGQIANYLAANLQHNEVTVQLKDSHSKTKRTFEAEKIHCLDSQYSEVLEAVCERLGAKPYNIHKVIMGVLSNTDVFKHHFWKSEVPCPYMEPFYYP